MSRTRFTIDDVVELNERMIGYSGLQIDFSDGMLGRDLDLDTAKSLSKIIEEIINGEERREFKHFPREDNC
jgi:hypothetical protein